MLILLSHLSTGMQEPAAQCFDRFDVDISGTNNEMDTIQQN
jgi:hypothetical protein